MQPLQTLRFPVGSRHGAEAPAQLASAHSRRLAWSGSSIGCPFSMCLSVYSSTSLSSQHVQLCIFQCPAPTHRRDFISTPIFVTLSATITLISGTLINPAFPPRSRSCTAQLSGFVYSLDKKLPISAGHQIVFFCPWPASVYNRVGDRMLYLLHLAFSCGVAGQHGADHGALSVS